MQRRLQITDLDPRLKGTQLFAFVVNDAEGKQLATVYPNGLFAPSMLAKHAMLRTPGLDLPPGTQLGRVFEPGDGPEIEFDLLAGGFEQGWSGRIPGLSQRGSYTVTAIYSPNLFGSWSDGKRGITLSNSISVSVE